jgi:putative tryptophan/tyrosine transport system substrate-binding protein
VTLRVGHGWRKIAGMKVIHATFAIVLAFGVLTASHTASSQAPAKVARVGVLLYGSPADDPNLRAFRDALRDLGYVEGRNVTFEYRFAEGKPERLPALAAELVKQEPHAIFAMGGDVAPSVRAATSTIPIVMALSNDPVQTQLVSSLARPGGNATGVTFIASDLAAKRLQLLKEIAPAITRVGILWNPDHVDPEYRESQAAARQLGIQLHSLEARRRSDFDEAFAAATAARVEAIVVVSSRLMTLSRPQITEFAAKHRIILVSGWGPWVQHGALLSYGPDLNAIVRVAATQTDKILKGAKPGDLPIEQPTKFQLVINTKTAKAFGLTVPPALLLRADQIIE